MISLRSNRTSKTGCAHVGTPGPYATDIGTLCQQVPTVFFGKHAKVKAPTSRTEREGPHLLLNTRLSTRIGYLMLGEKLQEAKRKTFQGTKSKKVSDSKSPSYFSYLITRKTLANLRAKDKALQDETPVNRSKFATATTQGCPHKLPVRSLYF